MMKNAGIAIAALLMTAGCGWSNPAEARWLHEGKARHDAYGVHLVRTAQYEGERAGHPELEGLQPNLDTWRATVLENADAVTLARMEEDHLRRLESLKARLAVLEQSAYRLHHHEESALRLEIAKEERKLLLIDVYR